MSSSDAPKTKDKPPAQRQRKTHRKSRLGCGNCKLRSVKCDESKPTCKRCAASGFTCSYTRAGGPSSDLQLAHSGSFNLDLSSDSRTSSFSFSSPPDKDMTRQTSTGLSLMKGLAIGMTRVLDLGPARQNPLGMAMVGGGPSWELPAPNPRRHVPVALPLSDSEGQYELSMEDFAALDRFHKRTIYTVGSKSTRPAMVVRGEGLERANPYLIHIVICLTLIHDAELAELSPRMRTALAFHWYHGTVLFKRRLAAATSTSPISSTATSAPTSTTVAPTYQSASSPSSFSSTDLSSIGSPSSSSPSSYSQSCHTKNTTSRPVLSSAERDGLWAASAMLGASTIGYLESDDPFKTWPLRDDPDDADLTWLRISDGKKVVWEIADPLREDSAFAEMRHDIEDQVPADGQRPIEAGALPEAFYSVFNLVPASSTSPPGLTPDDSSTSYSSASSPPPPPPPPQPSSSSYPLTPDQRSSVLNTHSIPLNSHPNHYYYVCSILAQLLPETMSQDNLLRFLAFLTQMSRPFRALLENKDPRALLLLAWWYSKAATYDSWWLRRRAIVQGKAICLYLERTCAGWGPAFLGLLEWPMSVFATAKVVSGSVMWHGQSGLRRGQNQAQGQDQGHTQVQAQGQGQTQSQVQSQEQDLDTMMSQATMTA